MSEEKVDILMATYNGEKYIREQLDSILGQTYTNFNLLISDDHSSDKTYDILKKYEKKDSRIKVYHQSKNLGYLKNFEFLCQKSTAKYVLFSDQDDVWCLDKVEKMKKFRDLKNSALVYCDLKIVNQDLQDSGETLLGASNMLEKARKYHDIRLLKLENAVTGCALLTTRQVIQKALPFPENFFVHDWWIGLVATQVGTVDFLDEALVLYRQHGDNSIGMASLYQQYSSFDEYYQARLDYRKKQFYYLHMRKDLFDNSTQEFIEMGYTYFNEIKIKNIGKLWAIMKDEKIIKRFKWIFLFHFPKIACIFWKVCSK